jgi:hypothetical protein
VITIAASTIRSSARKAAAAVRALADATRHVQEGTGLRSVDHRLAAGAPAPVAAAEGPRTRVVRWPGAAGAMDFGTSQVPQPGRSSCLHQAIHAKRAGENGVSRAR